MESFQRLQRIQKLIGKLRCFILTCSLYHGLTNFLLFLLWIDLLRHRIHSLTFSRMKFLENLSWSLTKLSHMSLVSFSLIRIFHVFKIQKAFVGVGMVNIKVIDWVLFTAKGQIDPCVQVVGHMRTLQSLSMLFQEIIEWCCPIR